MVPWGRGGVSLVDFIADEEARSISIRSPWEAPRMPFDLPQSLDILGRTPAVIDNLLRGTDASWHRATEGPGTWSPYDVVGHLIHADETDWMPRARMILEQGDAQPFEPFDRFGQLTRFADQSLGQLLDRFAEVRQASLEIVRGWHLTEAQLA